MENKATEYFDLYMSYIRCLFGDGDRWEKVYSRSTSPDPICDKFRSENENRCLNSSVGRASAS